MVAFATSQYCLWIAINLVLDQWWRDQWIWNDSRSFTTYKQYICINVKIYVWQEFERLALFFFNIYNHSLPGWLLQALTAVFPWGQTYSVCFFVSLLFFHWCWHHCPHICPADVPQLWALAHSQSHSLKTKLRNKQVKNWNMWTTLTLPVRSPKWVLCVSEAIVLLMQLLCKWASLHTTASIC